MSNKAGLYYDKNGVLSKIVIADNDDFAPHAENGLTTVIVDKLIYDTSIPTNIDGAVSFNNLSKIARDIVAQFNPAFAALIDAKIAADDKRLADIALKQTTFNKKITDFTATLSQSQKDAIAAKGNNFILFTQPFPADIAITPNQLIAYTDILKGNP